ncbi:response regulator [Sphingomonas sp. DT-204]|uniref:response regulator n=1 Tax=Sphingomonas sp. DT-204 TaxID=3396166 RepID=UPI003F541082
MDLSFPHPRTLPPSGGTILVVEDDVRIRRSTAAALRANGFRVTEAGSGEEALLALSGARPIDCVFSDVRMPGSHDGIALARWVLAHRPGLPILLTSGDVRSEDLDPGLRRRVSVLPKPYHPALVIGEIAALIAVGQRREAAVR